MITSINSWREGYAKYLKLGWRVLIVADKRTPIDSFREFSHNFFEILTLEMQNDLFPTLSKLLPLNSYARKNLGYLYALQSGAERIWDTDDDTFIRQEFLNEDFLSNFVDIKSVGGDGVLNPYTYFAPGSGIWPRGFPLRLLEKKDSNHVISKLNLDIDRVKDFDLIQTLVNICPDVDAIYRLTISNTSLEFDISRTLLLIDSPLLVPGNTQSTFWQKKATFAWMYIPSSVSFRFCDIFRSYVLQSNCRVAHAGFVSEQFRNPHDLMLDFESEIECYLNVDRLIDCIRESMGDNLIQVYEKLVKNQLVNTDEIRKVEAFQEIVDKVLC